MDAGPVAPDECGVRTTAHWGGCTEQGSGENVTTGATFDGWVELSGVATDLVVGDYLETIGDGRKDRREEFIFCVISSVAPASRRNHLEVLMVADKSGRDAVRRRWSLHVDYPVTYRRRPELLAPKELSTGIRSSASSR